MNLTSPVLILGARSDIGRAIAHAYASKGCDVVLAARNSNALERDCADLAVRYLVKAEHVEFDVLAPTPDAFFARLPVVARTVVMVVGLMGDHERSLADDVEVVRVMESNYSGPARYLLAAVRAMGQQGGAVVGVSSVAGDRGRGSNFIYGSAKAGFTAFLSGLRNRLAGQNIHVLTVKPGFVATRMTAELRLPPALTATPEAVAAAVVSAHEKGLDVIYVKPVWALIMLIIRAVPESVFKKLKL